MQNVISNENINDLFQIRREILDIYNTELGVYSQINKRLDTSIELLGKVNQKRVMIFMKTSFKKMDFIV